MTTMWQLEIKGTPPTASPFRGKEAEMVGGQDRRQPFYIVSIAMVL